MMMGLGMGLNSIWMIIFWVVVIGVGIMLLASLFPRTNSAPPAERHDDSLAILKERYAHGELSKEEYESIRYDLEN